MSERAAPLARLLEIMRQLRDPQEGCPWDRAQSFATIAPYTIEEAYELADAIESGRSERICDELGDLLFQVVFHAEMASERGWFDLGDVAAAVTAKLIRRHPHVFASAGTDTGSGASAGASAGAAAGDVAEHTRAWETLKAAERVARGGSHLLADVPAALPALRRARKLGQRAALVHFDFANAPAARAKVVEELAELDAVLASAASHERTQEELGDLLFAIVNWARHLGLDAEESLRAANGKFERRFQQMETLAQQRGVELPALDAAGWDALWSEVK